MYTDARVPRLDRVEEGFRHEAFFYRGHSEFAEGALSFIREGLANDEPTLVAVSAPKIRSLQRALGPDEAEVQFADMSLIGQNPARIIPAWRKFVDDHAVPGR